MRLWVWVEKTGHLRDGNTRYGSKCVKRALVEGEGLSNQRGTAWIGRDGGSAVAIPFEGAPQKSESSETVEYISKKSDLNCKF